MRVGLNLIYLVPGETGGTETYASELVPRLAASRSDLRVTSFINMETARDPPPWLAEVPKVTVPVEARSRPHWVWGEQALLPRLAARHGIDLVHSLANTGPARGPFVRVVTVHDLFFKLVPEAHLGMRGLGMRALVPLAAHRADRLITDSQATRDDLQRHLRIGNERVDVVPLAAAPPAGGIATDETEIRRMLVAGDRQIVLCVAAKRPHKNLIRLVEAIGTFPPEERPLVVIPGYTTTHEQEISDLIEQLALQHDVRMLNWVDTATLEGLYAASVCVVCPSLYEGFGLPVLEAMARGVPVACSSRGSLAEVAGDAALVFEPTSVTQIAAAIRRLLADPSERARLRAAGFLQAARFSWDETALGTIHCYEKAMAGRG